MSPPTAVHAEVGSARTSLLLGVKAVRSNCIGSTPGLGVAACGGSSNSGSGGGGRNTGYSVNARLPTSGLPLCRLLRHQPINGLRSAIPSYPLVSTEVISLSLFQGLEVDTPQLDVNVQNQGMGGWNWDRPSGFWTKKYVETHGSRFLQNDTDPTDNILDRASGCLIPELEPGSKGLAIWVWLGVIEWAMCAWGR